VQCLHEKLGESRIQRYTRAPTRHVLSSTASLDEKTSFITLAKQSKDEIVKRKLFSAIERKR
jgi:hypothetical protein